MKAGVVEGQGRISIKEVEDPILPDDSILIKVEACAICGSDLRIAYEVDRRARFPMIIGHEMGRALGKPAMFLERPEGTFHFRRGFGIEPGTKVLMVEDVVTTGLSSREAIAAVGEAGGEVIAEASLVDRSGGEADLGVPFTPLIRIDVPTYEADGLPPELEAIPATKPGSREA